MPKRTKKPGGMETTELVIKGSDEDGVSVDDKATKLEVTTGTPLERGGCNEVVADTFSDGAVSVCEDDNTTKPEVTREAPLDGIIWDERVAGTSADDTVGVKLDLCDVSQTFGRRQQLTNLGLACCRRRS